MLTEVFSEGDSIYLVSTGKGFFFRPHPAPIKLVPGVKRPENEDGHSTPFSAEVKNGAMPQFPHLSSWRGV
jgi:hypothetical protein